MNTFVQNGKRLTFTNSGSAIASGGVAVVRSGATGMIGVAVNDIDATTGTGPVQICGVHTLAAASADTGSVGAIVYWDATNSRITTTSTSNTLAGVLATAKTNGQTTADVLINALPA